jgi:hypothetical protein
MPILTDVFNSNAFGTIELTQGLYKQPTLPQMLGQLGLFTPKGITQRTFAIEETEGKLSLIQTSPHGAPPVEQTHGKRTMKSFSTVHLAKGDTINASEVIAVRAFGTNDQQTVQGLINERQMSLLNSLELTFENMRLGAVQGIVTDSDGSQLYNWFTEFGISADDEIDFDLDDASPESGEVRASCAKVVRQTMRAAQGMWAPGARIIGLADDTFYDALISHSEIRSSYLNYQAAASLREGYAFDQFNYGGITFINYRGTDDNSTVAVGSGKCKFFPVGVPGLFQVFFSPLENETYVNTPGIPYYSLSVPDRDRGMWTRIEVYSMPCFMCTRPKMLQSAKAT